MYTRCSHTVCIYIYMTHYINRLHVHLHVVIHLSINTDSVNFAYTNKNKHRTIYMHTCSEYVYDTTVVYVFYLSQVTSSLYSCNPWKKFKTDYGKAYT